MAFEQADFGDSVRFDNRLLGSVGSASHIQTGPMPAEINGRPQLSLVPSSSTDDFFDNDTESIEDQWQERALCAQTDPEAFFPEKGGSTREAKKIDDGPGRKFTYIWEQKTFNPITNDMECRIHFKFPDKTRMNEKSRRHSDWTLAHSNVILAIWWKSCGSIL